jgi:hypothetical protein
MDKRPIERLLESAYRPAPSLSNSPRYPAISRMQIMLNLGRFARITDIRIALPVNIATGFALRVAAALVLPDQSAILGDAIAYREAGKSLWATGQLGTPFQMPLCPALVAVTGPGWTQLLIDISLSTAMIWLVYELANLIFADKLQYRFVSMVCVLQVTRQFTSTTSNRPFSGN